MPPEDDPAAEWLLVVRSLSALTAVVIDLAETFAKETIDVPTLDKLKDNKARLDALPDLHKPEGVE